MNHKRGEYPLKVNGIDFVLKFDMNALAELETALGEPIGKILDEAENNMGIRFLRAALYAGLQHDPRFKRKFTLEKAARLITIENMAEVTDAVINALVSALTGKTLTELKKEAESAEKPVAPSAEVKSEVDPLDDLIGLSTE